MEQSFGLTFLFGLGIVIWLAFLFVVGLVVWKDPRWQADEPNTDLGEG